MISKLITKIQNKVRENKLSRKQGNAYDCSLHFSLHNEPTTPIFLFLNELSETTITRICQDEDVCMRSLVDCARIVFDKNAALQFCRYAGCNTGFVKVYVPERAIFSENSELCVESSTIEQSHIQGLYHHLEGRIGYFKNPQFNQQLKKQAKSLS